MSASDARLGRVGFLLLASLAGAGAAGEPRLVPILPTPGPREGGLSDILADPSDPEGRTFLTISDRGPNEAKEGRVRFLDPHYHQKLATWRIDRNGGLFRRIGIDSLSTPSGVFTTGLPSTRVASSEQAWTSAGGPLRRLAGDSAGYDFEGLASDGAGGFWLSDEYGPRLVHAVRLGERWILREDLSPGVGLPEVLRRRADNKGMEGLARLPSGRLVGMMQGPLRNAAGSGGKKAWKDYRMVRIVVVDPSRRTAPREFAYLLESAGGSPSRSRIGAIAALDERRLLVVEIRKTAEKSRQVDLWLADLSRATDIHSPAPAGRVLEGRTLEELSTRPGRLEEVGVQPVRKVSLARDVAARFPLLGGKAEGVAMMGTGTAVLAFDDDFGIGQEAGTPGFLLVPVALPPAEATP